MAINPGRFDELVTLQRPARARNEYGEAETASWVDVETDLFAEVLAPTGRDFAREIASGARAAGERVCTFRLRWPLDVRDQDRLLWMGEPYGVEGFVIDRRAGEILVRGVFRAGTDGR